MAAARRVGNNERLRHPGFLALAALALAWLAWLLALPPRPSPWLVALSGAAMLAAGSWLWARDVAREPWRAWLRRTGDLHALAAVLVAALAVQFADTHGVTTDGVIYFTQLRSVIFDGDLDVAAEFAFLQQPPRPSHIVPVGPTFVWLPLYLSVAAVDAAGRGLTLWGGPADTAGIGLTLPYIRAALVSSFAIGAVGLVAVHLRLRREFPAGVALAATVLLFLATPLVWYMVYEPSMTHAASFGLVALFVVAAERHTRPAMPAKASLLLGALLGLAFMTRPQEAVFALFPAVLLVLGRDPAGARLRGAAALAGWAFAGALPFLVAQALHSWALLRREPFTLAGEGGYLDLLHSRWADTLWSSWHGFFSWTPIAYVAFVAMAFYLARNRRWAIAAITIVLVMAWVNGATTDWAGGWSFGGRRFTSVLVVLAPGVALTVFALWRRPLVAVGLVAVAAVAWNQLLVAQYTTGMLQPGASASFGQIVRQQAALATGPRFFYPFAFPANAWFGWQTGLPAARYDLLGPEPLAAAFDLQMNDASGKYLAGGWGSRAGDLFGELRWIEGSAAELLMPLDPSAGPQMLEVDARTRMLDPPQSATFAVLVNGHEVGTFTPEAHQATRAAFPMRPDQPVLVRGFNRVRFERRSGSAPVAVYRVSAGH